MHPEILDKMRCNICGQKLKLAVNIEIEKEITDGLLICPEGHEWLIKDGIIDFRDEEAKNEDYWVKRYEEYDYLEVDKISNNKIPKNLKSAYSKAIDAVAEHINFYKPESIIDIATGRGMLLGEIVKRINYSCEIISVDISNTVLKYNRIKFRGLNDNIKVNYIACNAATLPLLDNSIDMGVSFVGLFNMVNNMLTGIDETFRVIKEYSVLLNVDFAVKYNTNGYQKMIDYFNKNKISISDKFATIEGINAIYDNSKFINHDIKIIAEGIGTKHDTGIIPIENEWFGLLLINSVKGKVS